MSITKRLKEFLDDNGAPYTHCTHRLAYTAQEVASAQHVKGREMAKTVILRADGKFLMAVLPASHKVDMAALKSALPYPEVQLATEYEFAVLFPDCEIGAMAPFGNLYGLPVFVDTLLTMDHEIVFNAGTHVDTIRMSYKDFDRLVQPTVLSLVRQPALA